MPSGAYDPAVGAKAYQGMVERARFVETAERCAEQRHPREHSTLGYDANRDEMYDRAEHDAETQDRAKVRRPDLSRPRWRFGPLVALAFGQLGTDLGHGRKRSFAGSEGHGAEGQAGNDESGIA